MKAFRKFLNKFVGIAIIIAFYLICYAVSNLFGVNSDSSGCSARYAFVCEQAKKDAEEQEAKRMEKIRSKVLHPYEQKIRNALEDFDDSEIGGIVSINPKCNNYAKLCSIYIIITKYHFYQESSKPPDITSQCRTIFDLSFDEIDLLDSINSKDDPRYTSIRDRVRHESKNVTTCT